MIENNFNDEKNIKYIRVIADMKPNSIIMPLKVIYGEREFEISEIFDVKRFVVSQIGELCYAYHCKIKNQKRVLYLNKLYNWFVI